LIVAQKAKSKKQTYERGQHRFDLMTKKTTDADPFNSAFLLVLAAGIAGWAFHEIIQPENLLDMIRMLTTC
jgi:hypothetical protein